MRRQVLLAVRVGLNGDWRSSTLAAFAVAVGVAACAGRVGDEDGDDHDDAGAAGGVGGGTSAPRVTQSIDARPSGATATEDGAAGASGGAGGTAGARDAGAEGAASNRADAAPRDGAPGVGIPDGSASAAGGCSGPPRAEWPNATNTGVPAGTILKPSGSINVTKASTVIDGLDIKGCLRINASNVIVRRTRITREGDCGTVTIGSRTAYTGVVFEDVEIDAAGGAPTYSVAVLCSGCTLCRVKLHDVNEAVRMDENITILESYIYNIGSIGLNANSAPAGGGSSNIVVRHNTVEDPPGGTLKSYQALIQVSTDHGAPNGVLIENNLLAGGPWAVQAGGASGVRVLNNRVSRKYYPKGGYYGAFRLSGVTASGNVWHETGDPIE